jgi:hypothetical protein
MNVDLYKYRIRCLTDGIDEYGWYESVPTKCPTNSAHTISSVTSMGERKTNYTNILEESVPTGQHYQARTVCFTAVKGITSTETMEWPMDVSGLSVSFVGPSDPNTCFKDDVLEMSVDKNRVIGVITSDISATGDWISQNYISGQSVIYNNKSYTCKIDTIANEIPTDKLYWVRGIGIDVSSDVITNTSKGFYIKFDDGTNIDDVGMVISIDSYLNKIYIEKSTTNSFLSSTPTVVKNTVYMIKDYKIGHHWVVNLGHSKIGASHIPAESVISVDYHNKNMSYDKEFYGEVEILY